MSNSTIQFKEADFSQASHRSAFKQLMNFYANGLTGGGEAIQDSVFEKTFEKLPKRNDTLIIIGFMNDKPVALANCFEGFSTFKGKALLNIHDFAVLQEFQGKGIAKMLLQHIEMIARERDYCKITLEVLEGNERAKKVYIAFGFEGYELDEKMGKALFWQKVL